MTQEEKDLLLKDLCSRLPYGVGIILDGQTTYYRVIDIDFDKEVVVVKPKDRKLIGIGCLGFEDFKLILRPMSSITEEEKTEYFLLKHKDNDRDDNIILTDEASAIIDWLNAHHLDYRGLIEKGLAIKAPENMYKITI